MIVQRCNTERQFSDRWEMRDIIYRYWSWIGLSEELRQRIAIALEELAGHVIVLLLIHFSIWVIDQVTLLLWNSDKLFFGVIPLRWILDCADLFTIIAFLIFGTVSIIKVFRSN